MNSRSHWETVYATRDPTEVSWYRAHLEMSLQLVADAASDRDARIIDVGGGERRLSTTYSQRATVMYRCWTSRLPR